jgi:hypothetical protein
MRLQGRQRGRDGDEDRKDQMEDYVDSFCDRLGCGVVRVCACNRSCEGGVRLMPQTPAPCSALANGPAGLR